ncbi:MAG: hypothetical protein M3270_07910 [Thermoproteota archaeon]|nr:hypothetical protein [Thermoproteota archaeon]
MKKRRGFKKFAKNITTYNGGIFKIQIHAMAARENVIFKGELIILNICKDPGRQWTLQFVILDE